MRKFWFSDGSTEKALNGENLIWFVYPTGLGAQRGAELASAGNGFFLENGVEFPKQTINGEIRCLKPAYSTYKTFLDWLLNAEELYLLYQPESVQYTRRVSVASLQKTELEGGDWLVCPIVLDCLSPWFTSETLTFATEGNASVATVTAGGQIGATVAIDVFSEVTDPHIEIKGGSLLSEVFADAKATCTTRGFAYSNVYNNSAFSGGVMDGEEYSLLPYSDLSKPVFGRPKHGEALKIKITPAANYIGVVQKWWLTV